VIPSEYEEWLATEPSLLREMFRTHTHNGDGQCEECGRCWPCSSVEAAWVAQQLVLAPRPAPAPPPRQRAKLPPPAPGRTRVARQLVDGRYTWVVLVDGGAPGGDTVPLEAARRR
jgi:hypothetical protein